MSSSQLAGYCIRKRLAAVRLFKDRFLVTNTTPARCFFALTRSSDQVIDSSRKFRCLVDLLTVVSPQNDTQAWSFSFFVPTSGRVIEPRYGFSNHSFLSKWVSATSRSAAVLGKCLMAQNSASPSCFIRLCSYSRVLCICVWPLFVKEPSIQPALTDRFSWHQASESDVNFGKRLAAQEMCCLLSTSRHN